MVQVQQCSCRGSCLAGPVSIPSLEYEDKYFLSPFGLGCEDWADPWNVHAEEPPFDLGCED